MSSKDMKTEPRFMTMIQHDLRPVCKALTLDIDLFAKADTVFIDRASVGRILSYMDGNDIMPEWYDLIPDNIFVGTGLPVLVKMDGEYFGRMTGRNLTKQVTSKPFSADMEAYWFNKENLKKADGTKGNGTTLGFGRCPGLRDTSRYNERLFKSSGYDYSEAVNGNGIDAVSSLRKINEIYDEVGQCYRGMAQARTPLAPFVFFGQREYDTTGLDTVVNHCPYITPSSISRIVDEMDMFPPKRAVDRFMLAFTMTAYAFAANQADTTERYETVEVKPPKAETRRHSGKPKTTLLIHLKPEEPVEKATPNHAATTGETNWDTITGRVETITPDMAKEMLGSNTNNRNVSRKQVELFARTMAQQAWQMNGEAIKFSGTGRLLDGQHRLLACVESGVPFRTLVIRGLPEETQETMDAGKTRTMANVLELQGRSNTKQLATVARSIYLSEQLGVEAACLNSASPTRNELLSFIENTPRLEDTLRQASAFYVKSNHLISVSMAALIYWTFSEIDGEACERFFDMLATGANLDEGNPILVLRNTLFDINKRGAHSDRTSRRRIVGITVKAWNKWREGATVKLLKFSPTEQFPDAI